MKTENTILTFTNTDSTNKLTLDLTIFNKSDRKENKGVDTLQLRRTISTKEKFCTKILDNKLFLNMYFNANATVCIVLLLYLFDLLNPTVTYFFIIVCN